MFNRNDSSDQQRSLDSWLHYIAAVHPREIELGLERIQRVADRLGLGKPAPLVISVAGTNGKGSCVACMEAVLTQAGYRTGAYTSPHLHQFNERIRLESIAVDDALLCDAFARVESCREPDSLSYFEYGTLAALLIFQQAQLDVVLLEVGLGGRLDAVNIIDADVAVITSISLDHEDWLGSDLDGIAAEKAGILRKQSPLVYGEEEPRDSVIKRAAELSAPLYLQSQQFNYHVTGSDGRWCWRGKQAGQQADIELTGLERPAIAYCNAATALQALYLLPIELPEAAIRSGLHNTAIAGRFELRRDLETGKLVVFDVAHNPAAATLLATHLNRFRAENPEIGCIAAVIAVMADKDIEGMANALESCLHIWYIAQVDVDRSMPVDEAASRIGQVGVQSPINRFESLQQAYKTACEQSLDNDLIVVTGSFYTVAALRKLSEAA